VSIVWADHHGVKYSDGRRDKWVDIIDLDDDRMLFEICDDVYYTILDADDFDGTDDHRNVGIPHAELAWFLAEEIGFRIDGRGSPYSK
tara:strand:- start:78 stop:341 length:264 start_codon:yes stop_codon:yes gene_type:complete